MSWCPEPNVMSLEKTAGPTRKTVRLDLTPKDHARLEWCARDRGLTKAAFARQAVLEQIKADERTAAPDPDR
jgi:hypothetical protein